MSPWVAGRRKAGQVKILRELRVPETLGLGALDVRCRRDCAGRGQNERRVQGPGQMPEEHQYTSNEQRELKIKTEKEEVKIPSTQF